MSPIRQTIPGQFYQGEDEEKSYTVDVGRWFTAPAAACTVIKDAGGTDRGASNFQYGGSLGAACATISGSLITTPCIVDLVAGSNYRVEIKIEYSGEVLETFFNLTAET